MEETEKKESSWFTTKTIDTKIFVPDRGFEIKATLELRHKQYEDGGRGKDIPIISLLVGRREVILFPDAAKEVNVMLEDLVKQQISAIEELNANSRNSPRNDVRPQKPFNTPKIRQPRKEIRRRFDKED
jgi:hypothetical protein